MYRFSVFLVLSVSWVMFIKSTASSVAVEYSTGDEIDVILRLLVENAADIRLTSKSEIIKTFAGEMKNYEFRRKIERDENINIEYNYNFKSCKQEIIETIWDGTPRPTIHKYLKRYNLHQNVTIDHNKSECEDNNDFTPKFLYRRKDIGKWEHKNLYYIKDEMISFKCEVNKIPPDAYLFINAIGIIGQIHGNILKVVHNLTELNKGPARCLVVAGENIKESNILHLEYNNDFTPKLLYTRKDTTKWENTKLYYEKDENITFKCEVNKLVPNEYLILHINNYFLSVGEMNSKILKVDHNLTELSKSFAICEVMHGENFWESNTLDLAYINDYTPTFLYTRKDIIKWENKTFYYRKDEMIIFKCEVNIIPPDGYLKISINDIGIFGQTNENTLKIGLKLTELNKGPARCEVEVGENIMESNILDLAYMNDFTPTFLYTRMDITKWENMKLYYRKDEMIIFKCEVNKLPPEAYLNISINDIGIFGQKNEKTFEIGLNLTEFNEGPARCAVVAGENITESNLLDLAYNNDDFTPKFLYKRKDMTKWENTKLYYEKDETIIFKCEVNKIPLDGYLNISINDIGIFGKTNEKTFKIGLKLTELNKGPARCAVVAGENIKESNILALAYEETNQDYDSTTALLLR